MVTSVEGKKVEGAAKYTQYILTHWNGIAACEKHFYNGIGNQNLLFLLDARCQNTFKMNTTSVFTKCIYNALSLGCFYKVISSAF